MPNSSLLTNTVGQGNAGRIEIRATDTVIFEGGSNAQSAVGETGVGNSGGIEIVTGSLFLNNNSSLLTNTVGQGNAGRIEIRATDTVVLDAPFPVDETDRSSISTQIAPDAVGNSPGIDITTASLILRNAFLGSSTLGQGDAGKITIQATEIVSDNTNISSLIGPEAMGNSQGIEITTGSLSFSNSLEGIATFTAGEGDAGNVSIRATDSVSLDNAIIFSSVIPRETGEETGTGGDISITASTLSLNDAGLFASTFGQGDAGNISLQVADSVTITGSPGITTAVFEEGVGQGGQIEIETGDLFLGEGTSLLALTEGRGDAGRVRIRARDSVTLDYSSISTRATQDAVGNARGIEITTNRLSLSDGAFVDAVSNNDRGTAGEITVDANRIDLDRSTITASTSGGEGNINLRSQELVLRNNSTIDTDASGEATGGNIEINSDVIAALENSDISANAQEAFGGRITIATQGLFGTAFRDTQTPQSDITASSALGPDFSGTVEITPPEVDPASGLLNLPESPVDAASLLGKDFCSQQRNSQFIITGRGGIPATPADPASPTTVWQDWSLTEIAETPRTETIPEAAVPERPVLIEAQGWYVDEAGQVILTANPMRGMPHQSGRIPMDCQTVDKVRSQTP